jgi:hypothetical protein
MAALIPAGIGAVGSIVGGITGGKGAKKAAKIAQQTAATQIAASNANRDYQYNLNAPEISNGRGADTTLAGLLNIGGDPAAAASAFDAYKGSTGYTTRLAEGENAINSNAYARGMGNSGATLKALTRFGQDYGSNEFGKYVGDLQGVSATGANARGLVANVGGNTVAANNAATGAAGDASANAALLNGSNWAKMFQQLGQAGAAAYGSSYGKPSAQDPSFLSATLPMPTPNPYGLLRPTGF